MAGSGELVLEDEAAALQNKEGGACVHHTTSTQKQQDAFSTQLEEL